MQYLEIFEKKTISLIFRQDKFSSEWQWILAECGTSD